MSAIRINRPRTLPVVFFAISALAVSSQSWAFGPALPPLGSAINFTALSKAGISDVGGSVIKGNIGVSPASGTTIGLTCAQVVGSVYSVDAAGPLPCRITDPVFLTAAIGDMDNAYTLAAGTVAPAPVVDLGAGDISGLTLAAGLYKWNTGLLINSDIYLNGNSTDTWIMQIAQDLTVANNVTIHLTGGALPTNIYWQVGTLAALGTTVTFEGIILAGTAITVNTGSAVNGNLYAKTNITMASNAATRSDIAVSLYSPTPSPTFTATRTPSPTPSATLTRTPSPVFTLTSTPTATRTPTPSPVFSATLTRTPSPVFSPTSTPTASPVFSATPTPSVTPVLTATLVVTATPTPGLPVPASGKSYIYPSPSTGPTARIVYTMAGPGKVKIRIYNEVGDLVDTLQEDKPAGLQSSTVNLFAMAPGVYRYFLNLTYDSGSSETQSVKKFVVLK